MPDPQTPSYAEQLDLLAALVRPLLVVDVEPLREQVGKFEALGPVLEPTAYQRGGGERLVQQRRFLDAVAQFQRNVRDAVPAPVERQEATDA